jgi:hypothetical protein
MKINDDYEYFLGWVIRELNRWKDRLTDSDDLEMVDELIEAIEDSLVSVEEAIEAAKMIGVRNPAFEGDEVGWWVDAEDYLEEFMAQYEDDETPPDEPLLDDDEDEEG